MNKVGVYGSLRKGLWLRAGFETEMEDLETIVLKGYQMHSTGGYPVVTKGTPDEKIVVEIVSVNDDTLNSLDSIEYGAGYARETIDHNGDTFEMYIYQHKPPEHYPKVVDGDWTNFYNER